MESIGVPQTPLSCLFGHPNMMPKIEASKYESKPVKIGLPITFEPLIYPHDFLKSLFVYSCRNGVRPRVFALNGGLIGYPTYK